MWNVIYLLNGKPYGYMERERVPKAGEVVGFYKPRTSAIVKSIVYSSLDWGLRVEVEIEIKK